MRISLMEHTFRYRSRARLLPLALLLHSSCAQPPSEPAGTVEQIVQEKMETENIPALSLTIVQNGEIRFNRGFGLSDLENSVPASEKTAYRLASISKPITAVGVMQLAVADKIGLDTPVQQYCADFPEKKWPVTVRHLLSNVSGVRHYQGDEISSTKHYDPWSDGLVLFKDDPLLHEPGEKMTYSTYGFSLLGCAIEGASGMPLMDYYRQHIFEPAGMTHITEDNSHDLIPHRARGYSRAPNGEIRNANLADTSYKIPGGGLASTSADLARFAIAVMDGTLLPAETVREMWTSVKTADGKETGYGLGWRVDKYRGYRLVGHGGGQQGTSTYLWLLPEQKFAVAVMTNRDEVAHLDVFTRDIADALLADVVPSP